MYFIPDGAEPDLVFYYSLNTGSTSNTKLSDTNNLITFFTYISTTPDLLTPIGKYSYNAFRYNFNIINEKHFTNVNITYWLPEGTISIITNISSNIDGYHPSGFDTSQIVSGSGNFLNKKGFVVINYENEKNKLRTAYVYFEK